MVFVSFFCGGYEQALIFATSDARISETFFSIGSKKTEKHHPLNQNKAKLCQMLLAYSPRNDSASSKNRGENC